MLIASSNSSRSLASKITEPMLMVLLSVAIFAGTIVTLAPVA